MVTKVSLSWAPLEIYLPWKLDDFLFFYFMGETHAGDLTFPTEDKTLLEK